MFASVVFSFKTYHKLFFGKFFNFVFEYKYIHAVTSLQLLSLHIGCFEGSRFNQPTIMESEKREKVPHIKLKVMVE